MKKLISLLTLLCALSNGLRAQTASTLNMGPDARISAMGDAGYALTGTPFATAYNSAGILLSGKTAGIAASYTLWQPDYADNKMISVGGFYALGDRFGLALGFKTNRMAEMSGSDESGNPLAAFTPSEYVVDAGFAFGIVKNLVLSADLRYIGSDMGAAEKGNAIAAGLNLMYRLNHLNLAFGVTNLGSKMGYGGEEYALPARVKGGASYQYLNGKSQFTGSLDVAYQLSPEDASGITAGLGAEYVYNRLVALRAGYRFGDEEKVLPSYLSLGAGLHYQGVSLDVAYMVAGSDSPMKNTMQIMLGWNF